VATVSRPVDPGKVGEGTVDFGHSPKVLALRERLEEFMAEHIYPSEGVHFQQAEAAGPYGHARVLDELKPKARAAGLWNLFMPPGHGRAGLTNLEYAPLCEIMGRSLMAPEVFNCSAPDTGNMEVLARYGTPEQKERWLTPLLEGEIRSAFAMTEPLVASSDATNILTSIRRDGDEYVINGRKWFTTGATDPRCQIMIVMGKSDLDSPDRHEQQSMILVPVDSPGVRVVRPLPIFGYEGTLDKASEVLLEDVRVPARNILLGEGRGFEIAQGRLGPGRIHHCLRLIGLAERTLERMCRRTDSRTAFGTPLSEQSITLERVAESRILIEQVRLLTLKAAWAMDAYGNKAARADIAMIKVAAPNMACRVIDLAIQAFGGAGVTNDFGLAAAYTTARYLRLADGPDEVHRNQLARLELRRHRGTDPARTGGNASVLDANAAELAGTAMRSRYGGSASAPTEPRSGVPDRS
jgi:acyl-CoA dehydrogenase